MPKNISYFEHFQNVANGVNDIATEMVETARSYYCGIYQNTPQWVLRKNPFVSPLVRKGLEQMCAPEAPFPVPVELPFIGGQCCDGSYDVTARFVIIRCYQHERYRDVTTTIRVNGKILGGVVGEYPNAPGLTGAYIDAEDCQGNQVIGSLFSGTLGIQTGNCYTEDQSAPFAQDISVQQSFVQILNINRVDGEDNCGDPPSNYPDIPPPTDDDLRKPFDIVYEDNSKRTIYYEIKRDITNNIYFPPIIDVGGVAVSFDLTGICIGCVSTNNNTGGGGSGGSESLTDDTPAEEETEEEVMEEQEDGAEEDVFRIKAVQVNVTTIPTNNRSQFGAGSPDIIYAGWLEFKIAGGYTPRNRMDFKDNYFIAPEGATGYAYCLKTGFKATITVIREKVQN